MTDLADIVKASIEPIIRAMVDEPDRIKIRIQKSDMNTVFIYITTKKSDVGKIIGKQGRHAAALRVLTSAIGSKHNSRAIVEINAEET